MKNALAEDMVENDITTSSLGIPAADVSTCSVSAREDCIPAGWFLLEQVFFELSIPPGGQLPQIQQFISDGQKALSGDAIGCLKGSADLLLRGERVALNLLGRLSGIATLTSR